MTSMDAPRGPAGAATGAGSATARDMRKRRGGAPKTEAVPATVGVMPTKMTAALREAAREMMTTVGRHRPAVVTKAVGSVIREATRRQQDAAGKIAVRGSDW